MELGQQFCLRWNNYQSTLQHVFHKLWMTGTFVDVSLVVDGRQIDCHKVVLSACSSYFEKILRDHSSHPHPLILLHDASFPAVEALVTFMYRGEVNVNQEQLSALLRAAETLKVKGLADSAAFGGLTKGRVADRYLPLYDLSGAQASTANTSVNVSTPIPIHPKACPAKSANNHGAAKTMPGRKRADASHSPVPPTKRARSEDRTNVMPPTPPSPIGEHFMGDLHQPSPLALVRPIETHPHVKQEVVDGETDGELMIDESASVHSPHESESECHEGHCMGTEYTINGDEDMTGTTILEESSEETFQFTNGVGDLLGGGTLRLSSSASGGHGGSSGRRYKTYEQGALQKALEEVEKGSSIAKAAQTHGIPCRTLRDWMKRRNIHSIYVQGGGRRSESLEDLRLPPTTPGACENSHPVFVSRSCHKSSSQSQKLSTKCHETSSQCANKACHEEMSRCHNGACNESSPQCLDKVCNETSLSNCPNNACEEVSSQWPNEACDETSPQCLDKVCNETSLSNCPNKACEEVSLLCPNEACDETSSQCNEASSQFGETSSQHSNKAFHREVLSQCQQASCHKVASKPDGVNQMLNDQYYQDFEVPCSSRTGMGDSWVVAPSDLSCSAKWHAAPTELSCSSECQEQRLVAPIRKYRYFTPSKYDNSRSTLCSSVCDANRTVLMHTVSTTSFEVSRMQTPAVNSLLERCLCPPDQCDPNLSDHPSSSHSPPHISVHELPYPNQFGQDVIL